VSKKSNHDTWKDRIEKLKELGRFGRNEITDREKLIEILKLVDAYLIMSDYTIIHQLLGKRLKRHKGELVEMQRYVLPLKKAKELMDCAEWIKIRDEAYFNTMGDVLSRIGRKSELKLEEKIDEGSMQAITLGMQYSEKYVPHRKVTQDTDAATEKLTKVVTDGVKKALKYDRINQENKEKLKELGNNH
jgi:hypothetical protein